MEWVDLFANCSIADMAGCKRPMGKRGPREVRRRLGVRAGDRLQFEEDGKGMCVTAVRKESPFAKYAGIGNPGIGKGRKAVQKWIRELRGYDEE